MPSLFKGLKLFSKSSRPTYSYKSSSMKHSSESSPSMYESGMPSDASSVYFTSSLVFYIKLLIGCIGLGILIGMIIKVYNFIHSIQNYFHPQQQHPHHQ
jgi:hypothetical protein